MSCNSASRRPVVVSSGLQPLETNRIPKKTQTIRAEAEGMNVVALDQETFPAVCCTTLLNEP